MSDANKAVARRIIDELWNAKSPEIIPQIYAAECVIRNPEGDVIGPDGYRGLYDTFAGAFPDCHITYDGELVAEGDTVAIPYVFSGTHQAALNEIPATGKQIAVKGTVMLRFDHGQVIEDRAIWDTASMLEQLGILPT